MPEAVPRQTNRSRKARQFDCANCQESFTRSEHLRRHQMIHRKEKPHGCPCCALTSTRKDVISRHIKKFHPNLEREMRMNYSGTPPPDFSQGAAQLSNSPAAETPTYSHMNDDDRVLTSITHEIGLGQMNQPTPPTIMVTTPPGTHSDSSVRGGVQASQFCIDGNPQGPEGAGPLGLAAIPFAETYSMMGQPAQVSSGNALYDLAAFEDWIFPSVALDSISLESDFGGFVRPPQSEKSNDPSLERDLCFTFDSPFLVTPQDMIQVRANMEFSDWQHRLSEYPDPSRYRVIRYLRSFFQYMYPHVPIVHAKTFRASKVPAPLYFEMLACGAIYVNEWKAGVTLHKAVLKLLAQHEELVATGEQSGYFELWELQTRLLACQFGAFSGVRGLEDQACNSFPAIIQLTQKCAKEIMKGHGETWQQWISHQAAVRCVCWAIILGAVLLSKDNKPTFILSPLDSELPLPCSEELWEASAAEWLESPQTTRSTSCKLGMIRGVLAGEISATSPTSFGLLTLIGAVLAHICAFEAISADYTLANDQARLNNMEETLVVWEEMWKCHPRSDSLPDSVHGPLLADALSLLSSAYYHIYSSEQLRIMKAFLHDPSQSGQNYELQKLFNCHRQPGLKSALIRAAKALLLRARLGIEQLKKTAGLRFACYTPISAHEGALLLTWYLIGQEISPDPKDDTRPIIESLINEILLETSDPDDDHVAQLQRVVLPLSMVEDLLKDAWIWRGFESITEHLRRQNQCILASLG